MQNIRITCVLHIDFGGEIWGICPLESPLRRQYKCNGTHKNYAYMCVRVCVFVKLLCVYYGI